MAYVKIESMTALKKQAKNKWLDCFIRLRGGLRSSKDIRYLPDTRRFQVMNHIDDTAQVLTEAELGTESNILEAVTKGAFYKY